MGCVFCDRLTRGDFLAANEHAAAFPDAFPLSDGHCLIVPRRHEADFFALTTEEQAAVWALLSTVRPRIEADGYNVGMNVGEAAGQTVAHAHLHLIPRYRADVPDPRGGIRCVIPAKARYWEAP